MRNLAFFVMCLVFIPVLAIQSEAKEEGKRLFEQKCSRCHSIKRAQSKRKTREQWKATVMRMKNRNGASIDEEEARIIIEYLSEHYGQ